MKEENAVQVVEEINQEIGRLFWNDGRFFDEECLFYLLYISDGYTEVIEFLGIQIWSSDDDEREYDEDNDCPFPLKPFLIKRIKRCLKNTNLLLELINK